MHRHILILAISLMHRLRRPFKKNILMCDHVRAFHNNTDTIRPVQIFRHTLSPWTCLKYKEQVRQGEQQVLQMPQGVKITIKLFFIFFFFCVKFFFKC